MSEQSLPPLPSPGASDEERGRAVEARMAARYGAPTLEDFRRSYAGFGAEWPGDEEIRRRHIVAAAAPGKSGAPRPTSSPGSAPDSAA